MFGDNILEKLFADQFEPEGDHFLFRKGMKEAPVQVSREERQRYIDTYNKQLNQSRWGLIIVTIFFLICFATYELATNKEFSALLFYAGFAVVIVAFVVRNSWIRGLPSRELKNRSAVGEARSRAEWRRVYLQRTSYWQLVAMALFAAIMLFSALNGPRSGWNVYWLVLSPLLLVVTAAQLFMKWRLGGTAKTHPSN